MCCQSPPVQQTKELETVLKRDWKSHSAVHKLLLLGPSQSGKSTLFKQLFVIYGKGFTDDDKKRYKPIVWINTVAAIEELCVQSVELSKKSVKYANCEVQDEKAKLSAGFLRALKYDRGTMDEELAQHIQILWQDPGIQKTWEKRAKFQLDDSADYFLNAASRTLRAGYVPTEQDIIRARYKTTAIVEHDFLVKQNQFKMLDVGGQRNERKKWIHCFSNVTAIIYVAAISEYDQVLYEDESVNRLTEALNLFEKICESKFFKDMPVILFLNKRDLFAQKLKKKPLSTLFPEFKGDDYEKATKFLEKEFFKRAKGKNVYTHLTCATDTENVRVVFEAVQHIVLGRSLEGAGVDFV